MNKPTLKSYEQINVASGRKFNNTERAYTTLSTLHSQHFSVI